MTEISVCHLNLVYQWNKSYAGYFVVEVLSQLLWREDLLEVARRCHAGAVKVLGFV